MSLNPIYAQDIDRSLDILIRQVSVGSTDTNEVSDILDFGSPVTKPIVYVSSLDLDTRGGDHDVRRVVANARAETPLGQPSNTVKVFWNLSVADDSGNHLVGNMVLTVMAFRLHIGP